MNADMSRVDDMDKLRDKVNEALIVYNDYTKTQGGELGGNQADEPAAEEDGEATKTS